MLESAAPPSGRGLDVLTLYFPTAYFFFKALWRFTQTSVNTNKHSNSGKNTTLQLYTQWVGPVEYWEFINRYWEVSVSVSLNRELWFGLWMTFSFPPLWWRHEWGTWNFTSLPTCEDGGRLGRLHSQLVERRSGERLLLLLYAWKQMKRWKRIISLEGMAGGTIHLHIRYIYIPLLPGVCRAKREMII